MQTVTLATAELSAGLIFEQEPSQILDALLPLYLSCTLLRSLQVRASCGVILFGHSRLQCHAHTSRAKQLLPTNTCTAANVCSRRTDYRACTSQQKHVQGALSAVSLITGLAQVGAPSPDALMCTFVHVCCGAVIMRSQCSPCVFCRRRLHQSWQPA